jgi:DNA-binding NtrC family response regulator
MIILNDTGEITVDDLPDRLKEKQQVQRGRPKTQDLSTEGIDLNHMLDEIENNMIVQALELSKGIKSKAATLLGLNRTTLIEKLKKKSIDLNVQSSK